MLTDNPYLDGDSVGEAAETADGPSKAPALKKRYVNILIDEKLLHQIDKFWHQNYFYSRTQAIRWLLRTRLEQKPKLSAEERPDHFDADDNGGGSGAD